MNLAKTAGVVTTAITGSTTAGSVVKGMLSSTSSSSSSNSSFTSSSSSQVAQPKSEAILRLMYSNTGVSAQKAVADGTKEITDWYAQKKRESEASWMGYAGKQQTAAMIGGAFSAAGQGLAQLAQMGGKKRGGDGEGGGRGGRRATGGGDDGGSSGGGGGCANGQCNLASASPNEAMKAMDTAQALKNVTEPKPIDSSLNQQQEQMASLNKSTTDAMTQAQQAQEQTPPPPPPEPLVNSGIQQA